jgi:hypothetical protein
MVHLQKHDPSGNDLIAAEVTSAIALYVPGATVERLVREDARTWKIEAELDGHAIEIRVHDHGMPGWAARHLGTVANRAWLDARKVTRRLARAADVHDVPRPGQHSDR